MLKNSAIIFGLIFVLFCSCNRSITAPQGSVRNRRGIVTDAFGGWINVSLLSTQKSFEGELIALSADALYVMANGQVQTQPISDVSSARVILYNTYYDQYSLWASFASLATLSNGLFLVFTLPMNLITGISTTAAEGKRINSYNYPEKNWAELSKYARFPQGLPQGVSISDLKPRPKVMP